MSTPCLITEFDMTTCTLDEVRHVVCKELKVKCITPNSSANGGDYAHMLELFMVVDFPNGKAMLDDQGILFLIFYVTINYFSFKIAFLKCIR